MWPRAGACSARAILPPCAQLLWCELYAIKDTHTQHNNIYKYKLSVHAPVP